MPYTRRHAILKKPMAGASPAIAEAEGDAMCCNQITSTVVPTRTRL